MGYNALYLGNQLPIDTAPYKTFIYKVFLLEVYAFLTYVFYVIVFWNKVSVDCTGFGRR
jgi:hypothetical protein